MKEHAASLMGGYAAKQFEWRDGFIDTVHVEAEAKNKLAVLEGILGLRTCVLLRRLFIADDLDPAMVAAISKLAPPSLRMFFTWHGEAFVKLAVPSLHRLALCLATDVAPNAALWAPLFAGRSLPNLRQLEIYDGVLSVEFLDALIDSPMFQKLDGLELIQGAIDVKGSKRLIERKADLAHLTYVDFGSLVNSRLEHVFAKQLAAASTAERDDD
jgi:hypothetical protein